MFSAALEQAEQLFTAAGAADARIRPMLLFYGISQASRAIAAAAKDPELNGKGRWQIVGHGLSCDDRKSRGLHPSNLAETQMVAAGGLKSGLRTMQRVLGSPAWKVDYPVELGEVFAALPTLPTFPGRDDWPAAQFEARLRPPHFDAPEHHVTAWVLRVAPDDDRTWARFAEVPNHYGPLAGTTMKPENSVYPVNEQGFLVPLIAELPVQRQPRYKLTPGGPQPEWFTPDLAGATGNQHPFVLWWAVLFALSMRARYEPEGWTGDLNPDTCAYATLLQEVLTQALTECPTLILQAIRDVSA